MATLGGFFGKNRKKVSIFIFVNFVLILHVSREK